MKNILFSIAHRIMNLAKRAITKKNRMLHGFGPKIINESS